MAPVLDHIVLLVPDRKLKSLPGWLTDAFTVLDGGAHAGGQTENKLIVFENGVYIEIIAFVEGLDPEKRKAHRWGARPEGQIIDWALSLLEPVKAQGAASGPEEEFRKVQDRVHAAHAGIIYNDPVAGGRTRPDGTVLKWATASPAFSDGGSSEDNSFKGGELPFWCLDRTPRHLRVPHEDKANVSHPSGALGPAGVAVFVKDKGLLQRLRRVYDAIQDEPSKQLDGNGRDQYQWDLAVPVDVVGKKSHLTLSSLDASTLSSADPGDWKGPLPDVFVKLSLFTTSEARTIRGAFVDGWVLEIDLVSLKT